MKYVKVNGELVSLKHFASFAFLDKGIKGKTSLGEYFEAIHIGYNIKVKCDSVGKKLTKTFLESCSIGRA